MAEILVSTMNDVPGYEVIKVHGTIFGQARYSREDAVTKLRQAAVGEGANAVLAMRLQMRGGGDAAYGTAVTIRPIVLSGARAPRAPGL
jgi:uncharacterized protein YbjQ (UPF0145 family)